MSDKITKLEKVENKKKKVKFQNGLFELFNKQAR